LVVHDVFPENMVPAGLIEPHAWSYRVLKRLFDLAYAQADARISIGRDMQELLRTKTAGRGQDLYIPNWVDLQEFDTAQPLPLRTDPSPQGSQICFQFFGNFGRVQGIDTLLAAIEQVEHPKAFFLLIGNGARVQAVQQHVQASTRRNVAYLPGLPFARNVDGLYACDVAIVSLGKGMKGLGVPSKAYFSLAADRPILYIGDEGSELHLMIQANPELGWFCKSADPTALAATITAICETPQSLPTGVRRARMAALHDQALARDYVAAAEAQLQR
jgi:glycosyltransferase involved in cell wall biosynthesis